MPKEKRPRSHSTTVDPYAKTVATNDNPNKKIGPKEIATTGTMTAHPPVAGVVPTLYTGFNQPRVNRSLTYALPNRHAPTVKNGEIQNTNYIQETKADETIYNAIRFLSPFVYKETDSLMQINPEYVEMKEKVSHLQVKMITDDINHILPNDNGRNKRYEKKEKLIIDTSTYEIYNSRDYDFTLNEYIIYILDENNFLYPIFDTVQEDEEDDEEIILGYDVKIDFTKINENIDMFRNLVGIPKGLDNFVNDKYEEKNYKDLPLFTLVSSEGHSYIIILYNGQQFIIGFGLETSNVGFDGNPLWQGPVNAIMRYYPGKLFGIDSISVDEQTEENNFIVYFGYVTPTILSNIKKMISVATKIKFSLDEYFNITDSIDLIFYEDTADYEYAYNMLNNNCILMAQKILGIQIPANLVGYQQNVPFLLKTVNPRLLDSVKENMNNPDNLMDIIYEIQQRVGPIQTEIFPPKERKGGNKSKSKRTKAKSRKNKPKKKTLRKRN
jgi:hypothetical protein